MLNFYLYSITSISLTMFYFAILVFVRAAFLLIFAAGADQEALRMLAVGIGYSAVAAPLWWNHWGWMRERFQHAVGAEILNHQLYLYTVICLNALVILFAGGVGIASLFEYLLGAGDTSATAMARSGVLIVTMLLSVALWIHHWHQFAGSFNEILPKGKNASGVPKEAAN